jgi:NADPH-dependent 2,4-dienoyl-CoA reductase/sulfur reductase-like enzyme
METIKKSAVIIGGGPAGLAAAIRLYDNDVKDIIILEREKQLGGILRQCIHDGFGLTRFKETLSGPEYAKRFIDEVKKRNIKYVTNTAVTDISRDKVVTAFSPDGLVQYKADAILLTMGCRERTRGALSIPGTRPAGIFTAGVAQDYINLKNKMVGKNAVVLGSGDIGLIMARRLTLEGAKVLGVYEIQPYPSGLLRNIEQCLNDYDIPLFLSHTVTDIKGKSRVESVTVSQVDENFNVIEGTSREIKCDTLILSVGLIPSMTLADNADIKLDKRTGGAVVDENYQTSAKGIFASGNVLHVHDLVDFVSLESECLADCASEFIKNGFLPECTINIETDCNIGHVIPHKISGKKDLNLMLRVKKPFYNCTLKIIQEDTVVFSNKYKRLIPAEMLKVCVSHEKITSDKPLKVVILDD